MTKKLLVLFALVALMGVLVLPTLSEARLLGPPPAWDDGSQPTCAPKLTGKVFSSGGGVIVGASVKTARNDAGGFVNPTAQQESEMSTTTNASGIYTISRPSSEANLYFDVMAGAAIHWGKADTYYQTCGTITKDYTLDRQ